MKTIIALEDTEYSDRNVTFAAVQLSVPAPQSSAPQLGML